MCAEGSSFFSSLRCCTGDNPIEMTGLQAICEKYGQPSELTPFNFNIMLVSRRVYTLWQSENLLFGAGCLITVGDVIRQ